MTHKSEAKWNVGTVTGTLIDIENFTEDDIDIIDIAASLSQQRRYAGHTEYPWTVGQHIIFCSMLADQCKADPINIKACFLHDVEETWVQDIIWPIKQSLESDTYKKICHNISSHVFEHFNCRGYNHAFVDHIDRVAYVFEHKALRPRAEYELHVHPDVMEKYEWLRDTLKMGIPAELLNLTDEQVADTIAEHLTVFRAEKTIGSEISSDVSVDDIEKAIKEGLLIR